MRHARSARFIAIGASVALLALATLAAPASAGNTRDVYFGSPVVDGGTGGGYDASGAPISGTLSPLNSVTSGSAVAVRVRVANDGKQTLNKVSFLGGALADGAAYNPLFPKPSDPSLDSDLRFLASYPLNGAPACDPVPASGLQLRCYLGTLASGASAEYLVVIGTSSGAIDAQPFWLTASWNEGWSTTGTNAEYQFAVGSVLVGEASCVEAAGYFLANSAVAIGNTGLSGCTQQTTVQTAAVGGIGTFAKVKVGGGTPTSCDAVGLRCFGDDSSVTVYGGNPVGGGVLWTIRWDPLTINGKPYVTKEGLLIRAQKKGFRSIQTLPVQERDDPEDPYFEFEAKIYPNFSDKDYELLISMRGIDRDSFRKVFEDLMRPTIARGYACKENVRNPELVRQKQLKNLAETRALCRALRVYTGCGLTAFEELPEVGG